MNTQTTVLLIGALAKIMELSRTNCSVIAEQTVIALQALNRSPGLPLSLKAQIEEMLDTLEEQYHLDQNQQNMPIHIHNQLIYSASIRYRFATLYFLKIPV